MDATTEIVSALDPARVVAGMKALHPSMTITTMRHEALVPGYLNDIEWNLYDEHHRIHVHDTYHDFFKVMNGRHFSVNTVRWGALPLFVQVANGKIADGVFVQAMTILGVIVCTQVVELTQVGEQVRIRIDWYTASHWSLRWLHGLFNRRLRRLQEKQNVEDNVEIRQRRYELRKLGFRFATDAADFVNSNHLGDHVIIPAATPAAVPLDSISTTAVTPLTLGPVELLATRRNGGVTLWPSLCPHEGGRMTERDLCGDIAQCPWHGRKFPPVTLGPHGVAEWRFLNARIRLDGTRLVLEVLAPDRRAERCQAPIPSARC
jgi:nitrite reductase/ring-hydroxylating ferredoxin subunit